MINLFSIGRISKPHGIRGEVNVIPFDENLDIFKNLECVFLSKSDTLEDDLTPVNITSIKFKNKIVKR